MKLKEARVRNFLSMAKLANKAQVSVATIRDTEAGRHRPTLTTCRKLGEALGMSPESIEECRETMERVLQMGVTALKRPLRAARRRFNSPSTFG